MEIKVQYERLFNLGNFDHEKFTITKEVEYTSTEAMTMKKLSIIVADLEVDLANYRQLHNLIQSVKERLTWDNEPEVDVKLEADLKDLMRRDKAFREKHYPVHKACKCYYCRHPDGQNDE